MKAPGKGKAFPKGGEDKNVRGGLFRSRGDGGPAGGGEYFKTR